MISINIKKRQQNAGLSKSPLEDTHAPRPNSTNYGTHYRRTRTETRAHTHTQTHTRTHTCACPHHPRTSDANRREKSQRIHCFQKHPKKFYIVACKSTLKHYNIGDQITNDISKSSCKRARRKKTPATFETPPHTGRSPEAVKFALRNQNAPSNGLLHFFAAGTKRGTPLFMRIKKHMVLQEKLPPPLTLSSSPFFAKKGKTKKKKGGFSLPR